MGAGALLADPRVAVCSFTGSSRGGEAVLNAAAPFARPSALELGGKGALVVLDDAGTSRAAADQALVGILSCLWRAGVRFVFSCLRRRRAVAATRRRPTRRSPVDGAGRAVSRCSAQARAGGSFRYALVVDPTADLRRCRRTSAREDGRRRRRQAARRGDDDGAARVAGAAGARPRLVERRGGPPRRVPAAAQADGAGYFAPPTLVTGDLEGAGIWREEVFGPVLCAMPFESDDDAIALANAVAVRFGARRVLGGRRARGVRCADAAGRGRRLGERQPDPLAGHALVGASGFGFEQGVEGMVSAAEDFSRRRTCSFLAVGRSPLPPRPSSLLRVLAARVFRVSQRVGQSSPKFAVPVVANRRWRRSEVNA